MHTNIQILMASLTKETIQAELMSDLGSAGFSLQLEIGSLNWTQPTISTPQCTNSPKSVSPAPTSHDTQVNGTLNHYSLTHFILVF